MIKLKDVSERLDIGLRNFIRKNGCFPKLIHISCEAEDAFYLLGDDVIKYHVSMSKRPPHISKEVAWNAFWHYGASAVINRFNGVPINWVNDSKMEFEFLPGGINKLTKS